MSINPQELTVTQRATQVIQAITEQKVPVHLKLMIQPFLNQFLQLSESDVDTDSKVIDFINEVESYINYIKTGQTE